MAGMDAQITGSGADLQRVNDRVLLKMALDRKTYRQARKEVQDEDALKAPPPSSTQEARPSAEPTSASVQVLEIHGTRVQVAAENGRATVSVVHIDLRTTHALIQGQAPPRKDPLVLDLSGDGPTTTGVEGARPFDLQGTGAAAPTSFVRGGSAFLVLDRNGNGSIDSGQELFGDQHGAPDGFAELSRFDANGDGVIDARDPVFSDLKLLFNDGHQQSLADSGIARIDLASGSGYDLPNGDTVLKQGLAYRADGSQVGTYAMGLQQFGTQA